MMGDGPSAAVAADDLYIGPPTWITYGFHGGWLWPLDQATR